MTSLEHYAVKIKPALDMFLRAPSINTLEAFHKEIKNYDWKNLRLFDVQMLIPLIMKLDELKGLNQDLQCGTINCIKYIISKQYINDKKGLSTILIIVLKQIRAFETATTLPSLSEEIKLAVVECITETLCQSTGEALELFYINDSVSLIGHILLTLVELIEYERYKKLRLAAIKCLMAVFYVHDQADLLDVVLRYQVADITFIYLPKVITVLSNISVSDETTGDLLKSASIKALNRILCLMYEDTQGDFISTSYSIEEFELLVRNALDNDKIKATDRDNEILGINKGKHYLQERMAQLQKDGRTKEWFGASSRKFRVIFVKLSILPSHQSSLIRLNFAEMCCNLLEHCGRNLSENFLALLENIVTMSEDENPKIQKLCKETLRKIQSKKKNVALFDENSDLLFEKHLTQFPRIIIRCQEDEQFAELTFLKSFLLNISKTKLKLIFTLQNDVDLFTQCLLEATYLITNNEFLHEEYVILKVDQMYNEFTEVSKLPWRQFKNLSSLRCINALKSICGIIGSTDFINQIFFHHLIDLMSKNHSLMNEIILIILWMLTENPSENKYKRLLLIDEFLNELLDEKHWHLVLQADPNYQLKPDKPSYWFVDRTPGLYESAIEIRTQDCDSDDDNNDNDAFKNRVTLNDVQFNVLHTAIVLDAIGHCASFIGDTFDKYLFRILHKILMKFANSNAIVHKAAFFALVSIQKALKYSNLTQLIECNVDYITHHLNSTFKRFPENSEAIDIFTSVLQLSTERTLPHLSKVFETIKEECSKSHQRPNINSYLKVYLAFLENVSRWYFNCQDNFNTDVNKMETETIDNDIFANWLSRLEKSTILDDSIEDTCGSPDVQIADESLTNNAEKESNDLPAHIVTIKSVLSQVKKFLPSIDKSHQLLSLECLIVGCPLLKDYENELLPLVHCIWQSFVEKFRQKDALVLNRCFSLLNVLGHCAKEFILKRTMDNIFPFLKDFLKQAVAHSAGEFGTAQTQEYKLQKILLREMGNFVEDLQIEGKHLNEFIDVASYYLSRNQPIELQELTVSTFEKFKIFNGPLTYAVMMKKAHLPEYKQNTDKLFLNFGIN